MTTSPAQSAETWTVGVLLKNDNVALYAGAPTYPTERQARLVAQDNHRAKPHMEFIPIRLKPTWLSV